MVTKQEYLHDSEFIDNVSILCRQISENVFNDAPVFGHLCDPRFNTLQVVSARDFGTKLMFKAGELYYTSQVTEGDAKSLGEFLVETGFFDDNPKTIQLSKSGNTYQLRIVVQEGIEKSEEMLAVFKEMAQLLSDSIFNGAPVEVHVCNDRLRTLKVVTA
jgi:hypothetical protein